MLRRFSFLIREYQRRGSQLGGLGVIRPGGHGAEFTGVISPNAVSQDLRQQK